MTVLASGNTHLSSPVKLKIMSTLHLFLIFAGAYQPVSGAIITLTTEDNIKKRIEAGSSGDVFLLKNSRYFIKGTIHVPSGTKIQGLPGTVLFKTFDMNERAFFDVTNTTDVTISTLTIELDAGNIGITSQEDMVSITQNLRIEQVNISGNLQKDLTQALDASRPGIYLPNVYNLKILNSQVENTIGGIYAMGKQITIDGNRLHEVNFGNIVAQGSRINITHNTVTEAGKGTLFESSSGDSITIGAHSSDIQLSDNKLSSGYCYMIWVHPNAKNIRITGNIIEAGITHGIYLEQTNQAIVSENQFLLNLASGLAVDRDSDDIFIVNNHFYGNPLYVGPTTTNVIASNNIFDGNRVDSPIINSDSKIKLDNNVVNYYPDDILPPRLIVTTMDGQIINNGNNIAFHKESFYSVSFQLINEGQEPIKLYGAPLVMLSPHVLFNEPCCQHPLGASISDNFIIKSYDQPHQRVLRQNESVIFRLNTWPVDDNLKKDKTEVIVNINTNNKLYKPFWFKVSLI